MSLKETIKDFILWNDLFSNSIDFYYHNKKTYPTVCGGSTTIFFFLIMFLYACYLTNSIIKGENSIVVQKQFKLESPQIMFIKKDYSYMFPDQSKFEIPYYLKNQTFYFYISIGMQDNSKNLEFQKEDPSYFSLLIREVSNKSNVIQYRPLSYFLCNKFGDFDSSFKQLNLSFTYCINDSYEISGESGFDFSKLAISVMKCINSSTSSIKCKTPNQIDDKISNLKMTMYYSVNLINMTDFNPIITTLKNQYWDVNSSWKKSSLMKLDIKQLDSYDSFLPNFISSNVNRYYSLEVNGFNDAVRNIEDDKIFFNLEIISGNILVLYERTYIDFLSQLSLVGGISNLIFDIGIILVSYISSFKTYESLTNDVYHLISPEKMNIIKVPFEEFIKNHYNKQIKKELLSIKEECEKEIKDNIEKDEEKSSEFSISSELRENSQQQVSEVRKLNTVKTKKRGFIGKILNRLRMRKQKKLEEEEKEKNMIEMKSIKVNNEPEKKSDSSEKHNENVEDKPEIKTEIIKEENKEELTDVIQIKAKEPIEEDEKIEIKIKNIEINEDISKNENVSVSKTTIKPKNISDNIINLEKSKNEEKVEVKKEPDSLFKLFEDDESKGKEINSLEKYLTREIVEKIYGIEFQNVKKDVKKIIKKNLKEIIASKKKQLEPISSNLKLKKNVRRLSVLFSKTIKFDEEEMENELEDIQKSVVKEIRVEDGVLEKIISQYNTDEVQFAKYKIIYEMMKFTCNDKVYFTNWEIIQSICCSLCIKRKYINYKEFNKLKNNFKNKDFIKQQLKQEFGDSIDKYKKKYILDIAKKKLFQDLDILNFLKVIKEFERFIKITLDETQIKLFSCLSKPRINNDDTSNGITLKKGITINKDQEVMTDVKSLNLNNTGKKDSKNIMNSKSYKEEADILDENVDEIERDFKQIQFLDMLLNRMITKDQLKLIEKKFFINMGIEIEEIIKMNNLIGKNKINSSNISKLDKIKDDNAKEMWKAYPNIFKMFMKEDKND